MGTNREEFHNTTRRHSNLKFMGTSSNRGARKLITTMAGLDSIRSQTLIPICHNLTQLIIRPPPPPCFVNRPG